MCVCVFRRPVYKSMAGVCGLCVVLIALTVS